VIEIPPEDYIDWDEGRDFPEDEEETESDEDQE